MLKRSFDIVVALAGLPVWLPLLVVMSIVNLFVHGWPAWFIQPRGGLNGRVIRLYKLRTMTNEVDEHGELLPDSQRLTPFGNFLRSHSLDELPSFINVLKGDISLVGPRPLMAEYLPLYSPEQARRHKVRPGITGWAQVKGRNSLSWEEKFELDVWYVDNRSFWLDLKILFLTVWQVIRRDGIGHGEEATMPKFRGSR